MDNSKQPLLSPTNEAVDQISADYTSTSSATNAAFSFTPGEDDIAPIKGLKDFSRQFFVESKKLWYLAAPAIFTSLCQYSLGAVTQVFAGHVSSLALAAVSVENSVIAGFSFGIMVHTDIFIVYI